MCDCRSVCVEEREGRWGERETNQLTRVVDCNAQYQVKDAIVLSHASVAFASVLATTMVVTLLATLAVDAGVLLDVGLHWLFCVYIMYEALPHVPEHTQWWAAVDAALRRVLKERLGAGFVILARVEAALTARTLVNLALGLASVGVLGRPVERWFGRLFRLGMEDAGSESDSSLPSSEGEGMALVFEEDLGLDVRLIIHLRMLLRRPGVQRVLFVLVLSSVMLGPSHSHFWLGVWYEVAAVASFWIVQFVIRDPGDEDDAGLHPTVAKWLGRHAKRD